jgi:hypothetical protein
MTSGDQQDWRGGRAPRNSPRSEKAVPSWKQSRSTGSTTAALGSRSWKVRVKIFLSCSFLLTLVVLAILALNRTKQLETHFVLLNLREASAHFDTAAGFEMPGDEKDTYQQKVTRSTSDSLILEPSSDNESKSKLDRADVVVVYLQTTFIPAPDGTFRCLLRNSTPNLDSNQYANLNDLKTQIAAKREKNWLLLVDRIPVGPEWRTGFLQSNLEKEFEAWVKDIPELVVVLSSSDSADSEPGTAGTGGRSIFSHFASLGLSQAANTYSNSNSRWRTFFYGPLDYLTTSEFYNYVRDKTNSLVRQYRNPAGQFVRVFPPENARNFPILRETFETDSRETGDALGTPDQALVQECRDLWTTRAQLSSTGAAVWSPISWRAATDELKQAEREVLQGSNDAATNSIKDSKKFFDRVKQELNPVHTQDGDFEPKRGFFRQQFASLPSASRVPEMFAGLSKDSDAADEAELIEDVIGSHLIQFSEHSDVNLSEPEIEAVKNLRAKAEKSIAQLFNCSYSIRKTVRATERRVLLAEDRRFTNMKPDAAEEKSIDEMLDTISAYARAHDAAETTLRNALDCIPELAFWSAQYDCEDSEEDKVEWHDELQLRAEAPGTNREVHEIDELEHKAKLGGAQSGKATDRALESARKLRKEVFLLCASAKGLKNSLDISEPETGFDAVALLEANSKLIAWNERAATSLRKTHEAVEEFSRNAIQATPEERIQQVRSYQILRSALDLTCVDTTTHNDVLEELLRWDDKWLHQPSEASPSSASTMEPGRAAWRPAADLEALWLLQVLNLMPGSETQVNEIQGMLPGLASDGDRGKSLGNIGEAVRRLRIENSRKVAEAVELNSDRAFRELRDADLRVRLYSGFDATEKSEKNPTARLQQLAKLDYCNMQAERLLTGLWIKPDEQNVMPVQEKAWFARAAKQWFQQAKEAISSVESSGANSLVGTAVYAEYQTLEDRLNSLDTLKLEVTSVSSAGRVKGQQDSPGSLDLFKNNSQQHPIDLGDELEPTRELNIEVSQSLPDWLTQQNAIIGEASVRIRLPAKDSVSDKIEISNNAAPVSVEHHNATVKLGLKRLSDPVNSKDHKPFKLQPEVFFRGWSWRSEQLFVSTQAPQQFVTTLEPRPDTASITVSGADPRPVVLILDFSYSMFENKLRLQDGKELRRYEEALTTLNKLIQGQLLDGSYVILRVFGHRWNSEKFNKEYFEKFGRQMNQNDLKNDDVGIEFKDRITADGNEKQKFLTVLKNLDYSKPFGATPLLTALGQAFADLKGLKRDGLVIAITDGAATEGNLDLARAKLQTAIKNDTGSLVRIIAFDMKADDKAALKNQFESFGDRIGFFDTSESNTLLNNLNNLLNPRPFTAAWANETAIDTAPLGESISISNVSSYNDYSISFGDFALKGLALKRGDAIELGLDLTNRRFNKVVHQNWKFKYPEPDNAGNWIVKSINGARKTPLPNNEGLASVKLHLMLDQNNKPVVPQPAEVEFRVSSADDLLERPENMSQKYVPSHGSPAWEISIEKWPTDNSFLVNADWKMERTVPDRLEDWVNLKDINSTGAAIRLDKESNGLPACKVWTTLIGTQLQVRIDPVDGLREDEKNKSEDIRIEVGQTNTEEQASTFHPWELRTEVKRTERGTMIYTFTLDESEVQNLIQAKVAFTSSAARRKDAIQVRDFLIK